MVWAYMSALSYLETYASRSTVLAYRRGLTRFFQVVCPADLGEGLEVAAQRYVERVKKGDVEKDLERFFAASKQAAPKTLGVLLSSIRVFLTENDVEVPEVFWRRLRRRRKGSRAITAFRVPSVAELRRILTHMDVKGRALFLMMASSGMRIGEALALRLGDIEVEDSEEKIRDPVLIRISAGSAKSGNGRIAFISYEAREALQEWLRVRENYLKAAVGKSSIHTKNPVDERLFPFDPGVAHMQWRGAISKAGLGKRDPTSGKWTLTPHSLRKFCRTRMGSVIQQDVAEALIGHEAFLTEVYRRHSEEDLAEFYKEAEPALLIFHAAEEVSNLRKEVRERDKQLQQLVNGLAKDNLETRDQNRGLVQRLTEHKELIDRLEAQLSDLRAYQEKHAYIWEHGFDEALDDPEFLKDLGQKAMIVMLGREKYEEVKALLNQDQ
jgi:integrase